MNRKLIASFAGAAMILGVGSAAFADEDVIRIDDVGAIESDGESTIDVDGDDDGVASQADSRLDGWAGVSNPDGVCASGHGDRDEPNGPDENGEGGDIDYESDDPSCNEEIVTSLAE